MAATSQPTRALSPPRAAAVAGVLFAILMGSSLIIIRLAVPPYRSDAGIWLSDPQRVSSVRFAVQLAPFAGSRSCGLSEYSAIGSANSRISSSPPCSSEAASCSWPPCLPPRHSPARW